MTFSGHLAVSVFVLETTHNPFAVILCCFLLHLVTDAIPHAEYRQWNTAPFLAKTLMIADFSATIALVIGMYSAYLSSTVVSLAIIFSLLPDLTDQPARRYLKWFRHIHVAMHSWPEPATSSINWNKTLTGRTPTWAKVSFQAALIILALTLLFS